MRRSVLKMLGLLTVVSFVLAACGNAKEESTSASDTKEQEVSAEDTTAEDETAQEEAEQNEPQPEEEETQEQTFVEPVVYEDANGWSLQYYENSFDVKTENGAVTFTYKGEAAGTNKMTVTYNVDSEDPQVIADSLVKEWGEGAQKTDSTFPTDESVSCVRVSLPMASDGKGPYKEAVIRSYMQGCLVFLIEGENSGDDEIDMAVSDNLAMLIDSVEFHEYMDSPSDHTPETDIEGCDTFTQIVDKLPDGNGYANEKIGEEDVLLVSSGTYDNGDGNMAAIDSEIYIYKDAAPFFLGYVQAGGTAYPLAVKDGILYVGSNHNIRKYKIENGEFVLYEWAAEDFDEDGKANYSYNCEDGNDYAGMDQEEAQKKLDALFGEYMDAAVIGFDTVKR